MDKQYTYHHIVHHNLLHNHNYITYFTYEIFGDLEIYILIMKKFVTNVFFT